MIAGQHHSGLVLGAYDGPKMVGVLFGFTALDNGKPYHYSHITGVLKAYQAKGVGFKLKLAQREHVLRQGQDLVRWTFDPLQAGNAYFNIGKLGAVCRTYWRELYGSLDDSLNRGRLTDRFEVEWWIRSKRVRDRLEKKWRRRLSPSFHEQDVKVVNETWKGKGGVRMALGMRLGLRDERLLVEIPESIARVRDASLNLARDWCLNFRKTFQHYFRRGYVATDVSVLTEGRERRVFYLLEHSPRVE